MNALTKLLPAERFQAWRVLGNGPSQAIDLSLASSLDEAIQTAGQHCQHKDWFSVLHVTPTKTTEHVCYVKQGKPTWVRKEGFAHAVQVKPLEVERKFSREVTAFAPVEPFRWTPGCDVVGVDRSLVEVRS